MTISFEEFQQLTREQKDKLLYDIAILASSEPFKQLVEQFGKHLEERKKEQERKQKIVFSKKQSIKEFHGLNFPYAEVVNKAAEMTGDLPAIVVFTDPIKYYGEHKIFTTATEIFEAIGIIPDFFKEAVRKRVEGLDTSIEHSVIREYGFQVEPFVGHTLSENGVLSYPGDPDLYPLCAIWHEDDVMVIYPYSWVAFVKKSASAENPKPVNIYRLD